MNSIERAKKKFGVICKHGKEWIWGLSEEAVKKARKDPSYFPCDCV